jgi:HD-like signal output (HDOD) protein
MKIETTRGACRNRGIASLFDGLKEDAPSFPTSAAGLMKLIQRANRDDCAIEEAVILASNEPLVAAKMVSLANSAAYNRSGRVIGSVNEAVNLLGLSMLKSVACAVAMNQLAARASKSNEATVSRLWAHSVEVAALSAVIARRFTSVSPDSAFFAGILHEIAGFYVLSRTSEALNLKDGDTVSVLSAGEESDPDDDASGTILAKGTARLLAFLHVPEQIAESIKGQWRGYLLAPPETLADTLIVANVLASTESPIEKPRAAQQAEGLELDAVLSRSEVAQTVRGAYDQLQAVQQAFARRSA